MALITRHPGLESDLYRTIQIIPPQCLFDLTDRLTDLHSSNGCLLQDKTRLAVVVFGSVENLLAGREPTVLYLLPCLSHLKRAMAVSEPSLLHFGADRRTELGNVRSIAGQLFCLVTVEQGQLDPLGFEILLTPPGKRSSQPADQLLAATMLPDILRLNDLERLIQSVIGYRSFGLF
jgi:hypothetical protein